MNNKKERFERLFEASKNKLYSVAYSIVHNRDLAEDVLQDAYLKAWKNFDNYDPEKKFENWMTSIVRNTGIDAGRNKSKRINAISLSAFDTRSGEEKNNYMDVIDTKKNPQEHMETEEFYVEIQNMISDLPTHLKDVMELVYDGVPPEEISKQIDISVGSVRSRMYKARKILTEVAKTNKFVNF